MGTDLIYRRDIDGLRAVAVVPVVLFHAAVPGFGGGFTGVDTFFVISGFLITSLIAEDVHAGQFSILHFYERRVRRIFPALLAVLFASSVLAALLLLPDQFAAFGRSLVATTLFASNFFFWRETGYFARTAEEVPLLHTWSLAVEEQFYLFIPIAFMVLHRLLKGHHLIWLLPLALISFAISVAGVSARPTATFYLAPTRAWELLLGSILAVGLFPAMQNRVVREALAVLGLGLICWGIFALSKDSVFPGINALFPCGGTALLIYTGQGHKTLVSRVLETAPMVGIGLISYSLYLWHWPLLVFAQIWNIVTLSTVQTILLIALSFAAAAFSWKFIEAPFRRRGGVFSRFQLFGVAGVVSGVLLAFGLFGAVSDGWPARVPQQAIEIASYAESRNPRRQKCFAYEDNPVSTPCVYGADVQPSVALWGDSHADAVVQAIGETAATAGKSLLFHGNAGCPPAIDLRINPFGCVAENAAVLKQLREDPRIETVILMARFSVQLMGRARELGPAERIEASVAIVEADGASADLARRKALLQTSLASTVEALQAASKKVVLVYPVPEVGYFVPTTLAQMVLQGQSPEDFTRPISLFHARQDDVIEVLNSLGAEADVVRIYPHHQLCEGDACIVYAQGAPLYQDDDHLSLHGARYIAPLFASVFE